MAENLKIVVPMAGFGTRMRPHTWSRPKPLISAAGNTVLGHVLDMLQTAPNVDEAEMVFIVGYLGDQVQAYMEHNYPNVKTHFVEQKELLGQSHAIAMARDYVHGPMLMIFVDTIIDTDFSFLADEPSDAVVWVKPVEDPRRFGVAEVGENGLVKRLVEKPDSMDNNLALVGIYYFKQGKDLMAAIDEQIEAQIRTKQEYFLADAVNLMLQKGLRMRPQEVETWLDAGVPETVLATNRHLLEHGHDNTAEVEKRKGVTVKPPVYVHPSATIQGSTIGPHVSIANDCVVENSQISDSVLEAGAVVRQSQLHGSIMGERTEVDGIQGRVNVGDDSKVFGE